MSSATSGHPWRGRGPVVGRPAFTVVEMTVTVGLIVLIMSILTVILTGATGAVSQRQTLSETSQKLRCIATLLRSDLETIRVVPLASPPAAGNPVASEGYFSVEENTASNPSNNDGYDTDDVLAMTCEFIASKPYGSVAAGSTPDVESWNAGGPSGDGTTSSSDGYIRAGTVEVCWFLRVPAVGQPGVLYRVQRLIVPPGWAPVSGDPALHDASYDLAMVFDDTLGPRLAAFTDLDQLENRFGHWNFDDDGTTEKIWGAPVSRADLDADGSDDWIGRPRMAETTASGGGAYPHPQGHHPLPADAAWPTFAASASRAHVDVVATNVLSFDVKLWDAGIHQYNVEQGYAHSPWVDVGDTSLPDLPGAYFAHYKPDDPSNTMYNLPDWVEAIYNPAATPPGQHTRVPYPPYPAGSSFDTWSSAYDGPHNPPYVNATMPYVSIPRGIQVRIRVLDVKSGNPIETTVVVPLEMY